MHLLAKIVLYLSKYTEKQRLKSFCVFFYGFLWGFAKCNVFFPLPPLLPTTLHELKKSNRETCVQVDHSVLLHMWHMVE